MDLDTPGHASLASCLLRSALTKCRAEALNGPRDWRQLSICHAPDVFPQDLTTVSAALLPNHKRVDASCSLCTFMLTCFSCEKFPFMLVQIFVAFHLVPVPGAPFRFGSWAVAPPPWHRPMMQWRRCRVEPGPSLPAPRQL